MVEDGPFRHGGAACDLRYGGTDDALLDQIKQGLQDSIPYALTARHTAVDAVFATSGFHTASVDHVLHRLARTARPLATMVHYDCMLSRGCQAHKVQSFRMYFLSSC
jgi:hypothetical protein